MGHGRFERLSQGKIISLNDQKNLFFTKFSPRSTVICTATPVDPVSIEKDQLKQTDPSKMVFFVYFISKRVSMFP